MRSSRPFLALAILLGMTVRAEAAEPAQLRFWNMTGETITELYVAAVGTTSWSGNLCESDPDHVVDPDERLKLPGVAPGHYDVRAVDAKHRSCTFHNVALSGAGRYAFSLSEEQMAHCR